MYLHGVGNYSAPQFEAGHFVDLMEVLLPDILSAISNVSVWGSAIDY
jgi:hypothetical protein